MPPVYTAVELHAAAHPDPEPACVVTLIAALCADDPAASLAETAKLYAVEAAKPITVELVPVAVAA
jgi:hypothetical protein